MVGRTISHYLLLEKLGEGGMGVVYKARDVTLGRLVALKFLNELISVDPSALRRFEREARLASALNHPNICTIYEVGDHEGRLFIAMELVTGQTLRSLVGERPLAEETLVDVGIQVADALETAHERGLIHRDVKSDNIILNDRGLAKILDFGLVKRLAPRAPRTAFGDEVPPGEDEFADEETLTCSGALMGTVGYMSPEQLRGGKIDHRTDLFSLGVVLYEMATGRLPFRGASSAVVAEGILNREPVSAMKVNPDLSPEVESIIGKALEKVPDLRYQHASELRADLQRLRRGATTGRATGGAVGRAAGKARAPGANSSGPRRWLPPAALVLIVAAIAGLWYARGGRLPASARLEPSIAVLPFTDMSPKRDQEYLSDGLAEELISDLAKIPGLRVTGRTSSFRFRGDKEDLRSIGRQLDVATVLEGSVRRDGDRVRVTAQLIDTADGFHLWSETFERRIDDIFALQEEIARSVASSLEIRLLGDGSEAPPTRSAEAYNDFLQGQYFYQRQTRENLDRALGYFRRAAEIDPGYAGAWSGVAGTLAFQAALGYIEPSAGYSQARAAVERALALDQDLPRAHAVLGWIRMAHDWDWSGAETSLQRARDLEPSRGLLEAAVLAVARGHNDQGLERARRAVELDPLNPQALSVLAVVAWYSGRLDEAESTYRRLLELVPEIASAHSLLGEVYLARSDARRAQGEIEREKDPFWRLPALAMVDHALGREQESEAALTQFIAEYQESGAYQVAQVYAFRGDTDRSIEWLERAYAQHDGGLFLLRADPLLKGLAADPRFQALVEKMGLSG